MMRRVITGVVSGVVVLAGGYAALGQHDARQSTPTPTMPSTAAPSTGGTAAAVVGQLPERPGYDRDCGKGHGCVFGPAWSDATDAAWSRNGCDTKSDVRRFQMRDVTIVPGTNGCTVATGTFTDPYNGKVVHFTKEQRPVPVQIDHVIPLAWAWNAGAAEWSTARRATFANDPRNLLLATSQTNRDKSDNGPAEWATQVKDPGRRCTFLRRAAKIARTYQLTVERADVAAFDRCGINHWRAT